MRLALVFVLAACNSSKSSQPAGPCNSVRVQLDGAKAFELPTRAEYCLYTPDPVACCAKEGTSCAAFAGSAAPVFDVVRAPGCPEPPKK
jgi:hypothetical protein